MIQIIDYSEKSIAVIGDTKEIKDQLKQLGGRFNFRLNCGAGWIFSKNKEEKVRNLLNIQDTINKPSVYVGTYAKYNNGNLYGKWIDLVDCKTYENFMNECNKLHSDEQEPEFMIQDNEYMPDGLRCGEWINESEFNDILLAYKESLTLKAINKENKFVECLNEFCKLNDVANYYLKNNVGAVKLSCGYLLIEKPQIENRFCFYDEGADYDLYKDLMNNDEKLKGYFVNENLKKFRQVLDNNNNKIFINKCCDNKVTVYRRNYDWQTAFNEEDILASEDDKKLIIEAYKYGLECFKKRLDTYLKRYGVSKLHTWTYWADR